MKIMEPDLPKQIGRNPAISMREVAEEWKAARHAVLAHYVDCIDDKLTESRMLTRVPAADQADVIIGVYRASFQVALSISSRVGRKFTLAEVVLCFQKSEIACFQGRWRSENSFLSRFLFRGHCPDVPELFCCEYWKSAARGFVAGLNDEVKFARHRSIGHQNNECLDYLYMNPPLEREWGVVPAHLRNALVPFSEELREQQIVLTLKGFSENILAFSLQGEKKFLSSGVRKKVEKDLVELLSRRYAGVSAVDVGASAKIRHRSC